MDELYRRATACHAAGILAGDTVRGLEPGPTLLDVIDSGQQAAAAAGAGSAGDRADHVAALDDVRIELPFEPRSIRDCAGFIQHLRNVATRTGRVIDRRFTDFPPFYFSNHAAAVGARADVTMAPGTEQFDFELEIAAVIGRGGEDIAVDRRREPHLRLHDLLRLERPRHPDERT